MSEKYYIIALVIFILNLVIAISDCNFSVAILWLIATVWCILKLANAKN